jgi:hypothetical protein
MCKDFPQTDAQIYLWLTQSLIEQCFIMHTIELRSHHLSLLRYLGVSVSLCAHRGRTAEFRILIKFRLLRVEQLARPASLAPPLLASPSTRLASGAGALSMWNPRVTVSSGVIATGRKV